MTYAISAIIIHWNAPDLLERQLVGLTNDSSIQVIVVDNASSQSLNDLKQQFPNVTWIENSENLGFAKACNQGAEQAAAPWSFFLNPDVQVDAAQTLLLIELGTQLKLDAFSPKSDSEDYQKPIPSGLSLLVEFSPLKRVVPLSIFRSQTLTGGALMIKNEVLAKLGGWDERFFLWFEDSDLTQRLVSAGYQIGQVKSSVEHSGGHSVKKLSEAEQKRLFFQSMQIYGNKHFSLFGKLLVKIVLLLNK